MEKDLMQALINHLTTDVEKIGKVKIPIEDPQTFSTLEAVMRDIKACALTIQQELEAEAIVKVEESKEPEPETPAEEEIGEDAHEATESEEKEE